MAEMSHVPQNMDEMGPMAEIDYVHFGSWCPLPDGKGPATQVHMLIKMKQPGVPQMVMRIKSARAADELIDAMIAHREDVFGPRK